DALDAPREGFAQSLALSRRPLPQRIVGPEDRADQPLARDLRRVDEPLRHVAAREEIAGVAGDEHAVWGDPLLELEGSHRRPVLKMRLGRQRARPVQIALELRRSAPRGPAI